MNELSLKQLRSFAAVYSERSFTGAAKALGMAQSPVSQSVAALERHLGEVLFERTRREVSPTSAAHALYPEAVEILRRAGGLSQLMFDARETQRVRRVRVGAVSSIFGELLEPVVAALAPHTLMFSDGPSAQLSRAVDLGDIDVALCRELGDEGRSNEKVAFGEPLVLAVPASHHLAAETAVEPAQWQGEPLAFFERERAPLAFDLMAAVHLEAGVAPKIVARISSEAAALALVRQGAALTLVPHSTAVEPWPGVAFVPLRQAHRSYPLTVRVTPGDPLGLLQPVTQALRDWAIRRGVLP